MRPRFGGDVAVCARGVGGDWVGGAGGGEEGEGC